MWKPTRKYETFSYLPDLTDDEIKKQVAYMLRKGLTPCLEFDSAERSFAAENPAYGPGMCDCLSLLSIVHYSLVFDATHTYGII